MTGTSLWIVGGGILTIVVLGVSGYFQIRAAKRNITDAAAERVSHLLKEERDILEERGQRLEAQYEDCEKGRLVLDAKVQVLEKYVMSPTALETVMEKQKESMLSLLGTLREDIVESFREGR